ncbi:hypothetical protein RMI87_15635 [Pseudomonas aeruginosa]|uniref:hypothetical protein n=1 Tax=Pseudomonas aeruginosa TaxID=287 RepID=UPI00287F284A|nr:hypothetical protein [Pseudomonas aeruginosa]MDS9914935.1 hypothetical protein [Pseudomonas aeruginosa]
MHAHQQASIASTPRVTRAELFSGETDYWSTCRKDDEDECMYGPLMMPYAIPGDMLSNQNGEAAWALWYGSHKDARKAANLSSRSLSDLEIASSQKLEEMSPFTRLAKRLDLDQMRLAADLAHSGTGGALAFKLHTQEMMPLLRLDAALRRQIGAANCQQIYRLAMAAPAPELAKMVEGEFPFMKALHEKGAFRRSTSQHLLGLACLIQTIRPGSNLSDAETLVCKLLITCIVRSLPARLGILVAVTSPEVASCFDWPCLFHGVSSSDFQEGTDIWTLVPGEVLEETSTSLKAYTFPMYPDQVTNEIIQRLDVLAIAAARGSPVAMELNAIHQDFLTKSALEMHDELKLFITEGGIYFAAHPYEAPEDMVRPGYNLAIEGRENEIAEALFSVILSTYFAGSVRPLLVKVADYKLSLEKTGKKIEEYSKSGSAKLVAKINGLGKKGMAELATGREWFVDEAMRLKGLVSAWTDFYGQMDAFRR